MDNVAQIWEYTDLDDFKKTSNNFYLTFTLGWMGESVYRKHRYFERFKNAYPEFEKELTSSVCEAIKQPSFTDKLPWKDLLKAYQLMSKFVYETDPYVIDEKGRLNKRILCQ